MKTSTPLLAPSLHAVLGACAVATAITLGVGQVAAQTPVRAGQTIEGELPASDPVLDDGSRLTVRVSASLAKGTGPFRLRVLDVAQPSAPARSGSAPADGRDPLEAPAVYIGATADMATFGLPRTMRAGGVIVFPVLHIFRTSERAGTDAAGRPITIDAAEVIYEVNCQTRRARRTRSDAYFNRRTVLSEQVAEAFADPAAGSIDVEIVRIGCASTAHLQTYSTYEEKMERARRVYEGSR
jgi:hypothetical protein